MASTKEEHKFFLHTRMEGIYGTGHKYGHFTKETPTLLPLLPFRLRRTKPALPPVLVIIILIAQHRCPCFPSAAAHPPTHSLLVNSILF